MTLEQFLSLVHSDDLVEFEQTMEVIDKNYSYTPMGFHNGLGDHQIFNEAGQNAGSCKIFDFARIHQLNEAHTLKLFGRYYREDVLLHPEGSDHTNIRSFMRDGWSGINFEGHALERN